MLERITARCAFVSRIRIADTERTPRREEDPTHRSSAQARPPRRVARVARSGRPRKSLLKRRSVGAPRPWACTHWPKLNFPLLSWCLSWCLSWRSWRLGGESFLFSCGFAALWLNRFPDGFAAANCGFTQAELGKDVSKPCRRRLELFGSPFLTRPGKR